MRRRLPTGLKTMGSALFIGAVLIMLTAAQAAAAPIVSQASAQAIGGDLLTTGVCSSVSPGGQSTSGAGCTVGGPSSNSGSTLTASVVVQTSDANPDGTSAACAGVTGPGGAAIQIGAAGPCTGVSAGTSSGVNVLGGLVTADAIYSVCADSAGASPTGGSTLASVGVAQGLSSGLLSALGAVATALGLGPLTGGATLPVNPGPNTVVSLSLGTLNILTLKLNVQSTNTNGTLGITALSVQVLGGAISAISGVPILGPALLNLLGLGGVTSAGLLITIGNVTCGPNAGPVAVSPVLPPKALPIAGAVLLGVGGFAWFKRERLFGAFRRI